MNERDDNIPQDAQDFVVPDSQDDTEIEIQHPNEYAPPITMEEIKRRIDVYTKKSKEAENEKEKRWYEIKAQVEEIGDNLGKGIDEGIKEGITALMAMDFPTSQSCDGHGIAGGWIRVYADEPDGWENSDIKKQEWREANHKEKERMEQLLQEFYTDREVSDEIRLILDPFGAFEAFNLQSAGYKDLSVVEQQKEKFPERVKAFRDEMDEFIEFLKEKYFKG